MQNPLKTFHIRQLNEGDKAWVIILLVEQSRRLKPEIPLIGMDDIPLLDEIELELLL